MLLSRLRPCPLIAYVFPSFWLEAMVHIGTGSRLRFGIIRIEFARAMVETVVVTALPGDWKCEPPGPATKRLGDAWAKSGRSAILAVPSVIIPSGRNYALNPVHRDFSKIVFSKPKAFAFDPRLLR
ncbi:MAG TPA: RES domain-containing protein [Verrucomicrobiae bacterium]|nr:RES domain-containing protein [Verrucomicrobiae bacterium]